MHFVLRRKLCQGFLVFQEFLDNFGLEGRCILLSHHALVYLISALFPVQILGSIIPWTSLRKHLQNLFMRLRNVCYTSHSSLFILYRLLSCVQRHITSPACCWQRERRNVTSLPFVALFLVT